MKLFANKFMIALVAGPVLLITLLALLIAFFPWDLLRAPLNRYMSERTGRHFEITRHLDIRPGFTTRILADGLEIANPPWARDANLLKAQSAEINVRLLPLLSGRIVLPAVELHRPELGLQLEADGRRTWSFSHDTLAGRGVPEIGALLVDQGSMHFLASHDGADIHTEFAIGQPEPSLSFSARGTWHHEPFKAEGRTGNALFLSAPLRQPFPVQIHAVAGHTVMRASGTVASLATLEGADAVVSVQGANLADLYRLVGVVLPATPRYLLNGHLTLEGKVWHARALNGKLGNTDLAGELAFDRSAEIPRLSGTVRSQALDFDDLAPLVGLAERPRSAAALPQVAGPAPPPPARPGKVLPTKPLDLDRLKAMDADVHYSAARVTHVQQVPLDRINVHVLLLSGVLHLDPMDLGLAGGSLDGGVRIDANSNPALAQVRLEVRGLELNRLFPGVKLTQASFGKIHGNIDLQGRGNSVAQMLGAASGSVAAVMGRGEISNLLLEYVGLDGGEIIKFLLIGDRNVAIRCAAAAFGVDHGLMSSRALLLDTDDTVIRGDGQVSLAEESLNLTLRPYPKDMSILALRSPLKVAGSFSAPHVGPDKGALAGRAGLALALGAINPLLALAATIETGPGQDADCGATLRDAASPAAVARIAAATPRPARPRASGPRQ